MPSPQEIPWLQVHALLTCGNMVHWLQACCSLHATARPWVHAWLHAIFGHLLLLGVFVPLLQYWVTDGFHPDHDTFHGTDWHSGSPPHVPEAWHERQHEPYTGHWDPTAHHEQHTEEYWQQHPHAWRDQHHEQWHGGQHGQQQGVQHGQPHGGQHWQQQGDHQAGLQNQHHQGAQQPAMFSHGQEVDPKVLPYVSHATPQAHPQQATRQAPVHMPPVASAMPGSRQGRLPLPPFQMRGKQGGSQRTAQHA
ncbi:hypothetical protein V8C86DRAFT_2903010 [Haematococcus lacustris]